MENITEQENRLFSEWKQNKHEGYFITDGVVNEHIWRNVAVKVLYLLKEPNGADEEWDERTYLAEYSKGVVPRSLTVNAIIKWQYGIMHGSSIPWDMVVKETAKKEVQQEMLSQVCWVNMKKTAGGASVDKQNFASYFAESINVSNLQKQLTFYKPDIVICGGGSGYLCRLKGWKNSIWQQTSRGINYHREDNVIYIDFWHPANRGVSGNVLYYTLLDAVEELYHGK